MRIREGRHFTARGGRNVVWVAFHDDHIARNHDETPASINATIAIGGRQARVTRMVTEVDQTAPLVETREPPDAR